MSIALAAALACGPAASAQEVQRASAPEVTAALIFNFVKFTTWPSTALADGAPIVVCLTGNDQVGRWLETLTRTHRVSGHAITISSTSPEEPIDGCHVVYGAALDRRRAAQLIQTASTRPILTMSDSAEFAEQGGVAGFFLDGGRMRFAVNPRAADRVRLQISSRLLSLARIVVDAGR